MTLKEQYGRVVSGVIVIGLTVVFLGVIFVIPDKNRDPKLIIDDGAIDDVDICKLEVTKPRKWVIGRDNVLKLCWLTNVSAPYAISFDCSILENCRG
jgi:hypothetical protein